MGRRSNAMWFEGSPAAPVVGRALAKQLPVWPTPVEYRSLQSRRLLIHAPTNAQKTFKLCCAATVSGDTLKHMFDMLSDAIGELDPPRSLEAVRELVMLHGRFTAIVATLVDDASRAGLYGVDDCVSMNSWLRQRCDLTKQQAGSLVSLGRRCGMFPVMGAAARDGSLTAGQVSVITKTVRLTSKQRSPSTKPMWCPRCVP
jgi:Domain of unknown function (DUF222)